MRRPFTLVQSSGSSDTARCVAELQEGIASKRLLGLAYVAIYSGRNYEANTCGEADRSPTFAHGAVAVLQHQLMQKILGH